MARKFLVVGCDGLYDCSNISRDIITLKDGEKANEETFLKHLEKGAHDFNRLKLIGLFDSSKIISWSLIEE